MNDQRMTYATLAKLSKPALCNIYRRGVTLSDGRHVSGLSDPSKWRKEEIINSLLWMQREV